jgi:16S rRNA (guanine1207-N2)-methyltransferase
MTDPELPCVEAARRTLAANGITNADVLHSRGADGLRDVDGFPPIDIVVIRLPKGKVPILQLLWDAYQLLKPGGRCFIAGGNDEGIRSTFRLVEHLFGNAAALAYGGGHRICVATRRDSPADRTANFDVPWLDADCFNQFRVHARGGPIDVFSRPGVFSWDRLDRGTAALLETIDIGGARTVLDLGCGYGIVGVVAARMAHDVRVTMVDASIEAVRSSRRTVAANGLADRCEVLASDVAAAVPDGSIDVVVTNPPFHTGKATDLDVPAQFIRDAARVLTPGGRLFLVANRTLPYEAWVRRCFGAVSTLVDGREFKVLSAVRAE